MAQHVQLNAETRELLGKKVRRLRREGKLPATVYGHNVTPVSIQVDARDMRAALRAAGRTQLIDLSIGDERARPVFVRQTAVDPKRNALLHIEFYQANLREKMHAQVPVHFVGESQAVKDGGILLTVLDHVEVESLPDDIPAGVDVDLGRLQEMNDTIHAEDLGLPAGVAMLTAPDEIVAKVTPPVSEQAVEEVLAEAEPLPAELGGEEQPADAVPEA